MLYPIYKDYFTVLCFCCYGTDMWSKNYSTWLIIISPCCAFAATERICELFNVINNLIFTKFLVLKPSTSCNISTLCVGYLSTISTTDMKPCTSCNISTLCVVYLSTISTTDMKPCTSCNISTLCVVDLSTISTTDMKPCTSCNISTLCVVYLSTMSTTDIIIIAADC